MDKEILKVISEKYNKKEKLIEIMFYKTKEFGYNIWEGLQTIIDFYEK